MWKAQDTAGNRKALDLYEAAFKKYPDSIDNLGLYKSSVIAGELLEYDKAFKYLTLLLESVKDDNGFASWNFIAGKYSESEYKSLLNDTRWQTLKKKALLKRTAFYKKLKETENEFFEVRNVEIRKELSPKKLYEQLKRYKPYTLKKQQNYSISFEINDSTKTSYFIHLPINYTPEKKYPMLIFLHGAVRNNALIDYQTKDILGDWNRYYTKYADSNQVILVFPKGSSQYNWMFPEDGFFMIPKMVKQIKKAVNVDDNKVFISGHSNGATGSFSYLMKEPTLFAGFYGFNTYPKVFTGGTFIENIKNRSFINFSTDQDYYYPPAANDSLSMRMAAIEADYKDFRYTGFPHWFPQFNESEPAYKILFSDLVGRKRKIFPEQISWEFDDENYGNIDWIDQIKLDTLSAKGDWHKSVNFRIHTWLSYVKKDSLVRQNVDTPAFDFPRKSGKINAYYNNNVFKIETSRIKSVRINISPKMVNIRKKIKVYVNNRLLFNEKVIYNKEVIQKSFEQNVDRERIWVQYIQLEI
jgi:hypothetical protein